MKNQKPLRLRHFEKATNSKVIMDVYWSQLKGNSHPYLSVDLVDLVIDGERQHTGRSQDSIELMKTINTPEHMIFILENHLVSQKEFTTFHFVANLDYHIGEMIRDTFMEKNNITLEIIDRYIAANKENCISQILAINEKGFGSFYPEHIDKHIPPLITTDKFAINSKIIRILNMLKRMGVCSGNISDNRIDKMHEIIIKHNQKYHELMKQRSKAKGYDELWTPEKVSECYNISLETVKELAFTEPMERRTKIELLSNTIGNELKNKFDKLSQDGILIPTING